MTNAKQANNMIDGDHESTMPQSALNSHHNWNLSETLNNQDKLSAKTEFCANASDKSEISPKSTDKFSSRNELNDEDREYDKSDGHLNGSHDILDKLSYNPESCNDPSDASESCDKTSINDNDSNYIAEIPRKSRKNFEPPLERRDEHREGENSCVALQLQSGITEVDKGNYDGAISIFDRILKKNPAYPEALIERGRAYEFLGEQDTAIEDFTKAIQYNPSAGEAWKMRGKTRAALAKYVEAIKDLTKALEFEPNSADILHVRGTTNFKLKEYDAAAEDLSACVKLYKNNKYAHLYLGLALFAIGEYEKAKEAHLKSLKVDGNFHEAWIHLALLYYNLANPAKAQECLNRALEIDEGSATAYFIRGQLFHAMGEHRKAIMDFNNGLSIGGANIESIYLRASCYHAVGQYNEAVKDYDTALKLEVSSLEESKFQDSALHQKEIALYTASKLDSEFCWFDIDGYMDKLLKELVQPKNVSKKASRQPPSQTKAELIKQEFTITKKKADLIQAADSIGKKIQYDCRGFLPNRRQHRMAGFAAIEIAQKVSKAWCRIASRGVTVNMPTQNRGGAACSTSTPVETSSYGFMGDRSSMSWQDIYSIAVKWGQISDPCDRVFWVNKLREFDSGFYPCTSMITGQVKNVLYFPHYYGRTFNVARAVMKEKSFVYSKKGGTIDLSKDGKLEEIMHAKSCSDVYRAVGEDLWLSTWCNSTAVWGKQLEGRRIVIEKMGENRFHFAILTPCTADRWEDFDAEMALAWEAICNAYCGENHGSSDFDVLENVRDAILRMAYYWYNFMPLNKGSAEVGSVVMLGLLLAANMEFTGKIPPGLQVDWEAILNFDSNSFVDSIKSWLYPSLEVTTSWKNYPDVASTLATVGSVVAALSFQDE